MEAFRFISYKIYANDIVLVPRDGIADAKALKSYITKSDDKLVITHYRVSSNQFNKGMEKEATLYTFTLKNGIIHKEMESLEEPHWFEYFENERDFVPNPFNTEIHDMFTESNSAPMYEGEHVWIDGGGMVYAKVGGVWIDTNQSKDLLVLVTRKLPQEVVQELKRYFLAQEMMK